MGKKKIKIGVCRRCGCTDADCSKCIKRTGVPCHWAMPDLCSACTTPAEVAIMKRMARQ